ncbi:hypothetical protein J2TS4_01590 [Paenibacillus sp. J2TS4]|nr:hypothetical protein J2TS4_01590 [Paenibacillus sp. J2TS4]
MNMCEMLGGISTKTAYKLLQAWRIDHFRIGRTIKHTVTTGSLDGNLITIAKDRTKNKSSRRTLPLVDALAALLCF